MTKDALSKYNLPKKVEILVKEVKEGGFVIEFPELPGCFTQTETLSTLQDQVTDAILTYFDVPRTKASKIAYLPEVRNSSQRASETQFDLFLAA